MELWKNTRAYIIFQYKRKKMIIKMWQKLEQKYNVIPKWFWPLLKIWLNKQISFFFFFIEKDSWLNWELFITPSLYLKTVNTGVLFTKNIFRKTIVKILKKRIKKNLFNMSRCWKVLESTKNPFPQKFWCLVTWAHFLLNGLFEVYLLMFHSFQH